MNAPEMTNEERHQMYREQAGHAPIVVKQKMSGSKKGLIALGVLVGLGIIGSMGDDATPAKKEVKPVVAVKSPEVAKVVKPAPVKTVKAEKPAETPGQENAREAANDYLDYSAFSKKSLIGQLKFEGYSTKDASYAASSVNADWNEQAVKSAKDYLDYSAFSKSALIEQLEFEGFTPAQAAHGASKAY